MLLSVGSARKRVNHSNTYTRNAPSSRNKGWKYKETGLVQKIGQYNQFSGWRNYILEAFQTNITEEKMKRT